jgi:hypothetical protein
MNIDHHFPPPPQYNQPPLRCDDITPARQRAINRLSEFAAVAESLVGTLNIEHPESSLQYPATARGFALHCVKGSPHAEEVAELLSRARIHLDAHDHVDAPHVMLIDPRKHWGVLGPIRGDVVLFPGDHAAIVTKPLCMGCQHFEAVSLVSSDGPPQIALLTHWLSTVRWIIRVVDEREDDPQIAPIGQISDEASLPAETSGQSSESASSADADAELKPSRKRKLTGLA